MFGHGGKRPNQGRPKGSKNKATLEKAAVAEAFNQRVLKHADDLFNAQFKLATGAQQVFRIDETRNDRGTVTKTEHVLVTDPDELKELLDAYCGQNGTVDGHYYYFQTVLPDNRALESLLNRTLGKAKESIEHTGANGGPIEYVDRETKLKRYRETFLAEGEPVPPDEVLWADIEKYEAETIQVAGVQ